MDFAFETLPGGTLNHILQTTPKCRIDFLARTVSRSGSGLDDMFKDATPEQIASLTADFVSQMKPEMLSRISPKHVKKLPEDVREIMPKYDPLGELSFFGGETGDQDSFTTFVKIDMIRDPEMKFQNPDDVVLEAADPVLVLNYPLNMDVTLPLRGSQHGKITRIELLGLIHDAMQGIYEQEDEALEAGQGEPPFGIYGHGIDDLAVEAIHVHEHEGKTYVYPDLGS